MKNKFSLLYMKELIYKHHIAILLCGIMLIGGFLRLDDFSSLVRFNNDQVRDAEVINAMVTENDFPLLGPKAGGTAFKLGPAFYYMEYISAILFGNTPQGIALFIPILSTLSILLFYFIFKKYFDIYIALILAFLYATSFYLIKYSRFAWNPNVIPFFLLLFYIALLKTLSHKTLNQKLWFCILGIVTGIGMQLHTTLLISLPLTICIAHGISFVKKRKISLQNALFTCGLMILFLMPMIISDVLSNGKNISAFLLGSESKSTKNTSLTENILLDGQFFAKSALYTVTGIEPTKNWLLPKKLFKSRDIIEISLAIGGCMFFVFGFWFYIKNIRKTTDEERKQMLLLFFSVPILFFLLLLSVAHELNVRFFIVLFFLPYLFLGFIFDWILHLHVKKFIKLFSLSLIVIILLYTNVHVYNASYNLTLSNTNSQLYGGISLRELHLMTQYIKKNSTQLSANKIHLIPHTYGRSIKYIAQTNNVSISTTSPNNIPENDIAFYISDKIDKKEISRDIASCFTQINTEKILRFRIFTLQRTFGDCK